MPLDVKTITLPMPLRMGRVNCYLIRAGRGHVLIDSGGSNARGQLRRELELAGCKPGNLNLVVLTHGDFDHIGNAAYLRSFFGAKIAMHRDDAGMAEHGDMFENRKRPGFLIRTLLPVVSGFGRSERFAPDILVDDGDDFSQFGLAACAVSLPGHSKGSIGILSETGDLFCGDLLENIREPVIGSMMDDTVAAQASIARLRDLDVGMIHPGHGKPFEKEMLTRGAHAAV